MPRLLFGNAKRRHQGAGLDRGWILQEADHVLGLVRDGAGDIAQPAHVLQRRTGIAIRALYFGNEMAGGALVLLGQQATALRVAAFDAAGMLLAAAGARQYRAQQHGANAPHAMQAIVLTDIHAHGWFFVKLLWLL